MAQVGGGLQKRDGAVDECDEAHYTNRLFADIELVRKDATYFLTESESDQYDDETRLPRLDIGRYTHGDAAAKADFAQAIGSAVKEWGFVVLTGHGIPASLYDEAAALASAFFADSTPEQKARLMCPDRRTRGYTPPNLFARTGVLTMLEDFRVDLCHDDDAFDTAIPWPSDQLRQLFKRYMAAHEALIAPITQSLLQYLGCEPTLFDERMTRCEALLRWNYYPAVPEADAGSRPRSRFMAHEDIGLFAMLPCPSAGGLQVLNRRTNKWIRTAGLAPDDIVVNVGDTFQRLSNDVLVSTTHRVTATPQELAAARISFPLVVYLADDDAIIPVDTPMVRAAATVDYPPIKAGDFRRQLLRKFRF
ncbi:2og-fe(ii) oxygenase [Pandoravirus kuranda]|uniref:2og-fe(Ii) oxygenase n=1 Tax=Pandoravirus kuranda TaxID=3019033 RepID=A0AA95J2J1_9VIRU|nr:2og-fe(ii) oxygenase [Pandoravirus kuranda]